MEKYERYIDGCRVLDLKELLSKGSYPYKYVPILDRIPVFYNSLFEYGAVDEISGVDKVERERMFLVDMILEEEYVDMDNLSVNYATLVEKIINNYIHIERIIAIYLQEEETVDKCLDDARLIIASFLYGYFDSKKDLEEAIRQRANNNEEEENIEEVIREDDLTNQLECINIIKGECRFSDEAALKQFFISNLLKINIRGKRIRLYTESGGVTGIEYKIVTGRIDILCVDEDGNFIVFEFKRNKANDDALGQLIRYMVAVKHEMANGKKVIGVIVAKDPDEKLRYTIKHLDDIELLQYNVDFSLKTI